MMMMFVNYFIAIVRVRDLDCGAAYFAALVYVCVRGISVLVFCIVVIMCVLILIIIVIVALRRDFYVCSESQPR